MKLKTLTFLLFIGFTTLAQVDAPFYYMDFNQWYDEDANGCPYIDPIVGCEFYDWDQEFAHGNRISLTEIDPAFGKSLKIRVEGGDHINVNGDTSKSRSEIALNWGEHILYNNMTRYYSYDLFIPNNGQFIESTGDWYNIFQWNCKQDRESLCSEIRPPILVEYVMPEAGETDNLRDLKIRIGTQYGSSCTNACSNDPNFKSSKTFIIKDAIELGKWNHMVFQINWSSKWWEAFMKMNINNQHVVYDDKDESEPCQGSRQLRLGNSGEAPYKMDGVPLLYVDNNAPNKYQPRQQDLIQNRLKIGHYRKGFNTNNRYFIDNFRVTHAFPPAQFENELIPWDCNVTLKERDSYKLNAYELDPTNLYLFQFYDGVDYEYAGSTTPEVDLLNQSWAKANKSYEVKVRSQNDLDNAWQGFPYGDMCTVTTPKLTQLADDYCNNYNLYGTKVYCDPILGATNYKFRIMQGGNTYWKDSTENWMDFNDLFGFQYGQTYQVQIRAFTNEYPSGFSYGNSCNVKFIYTGFSGSSQGNGNNATGPIDGNYIQVSPNPSNGIVNIRSLKPDSTIQEISVFNVNGQLLISSEFSDRIDISLLPKGVYFMNINIDDLSVIKRVIKN